MSMSSEMRVGSTVEGVGVGEEGLSGGDEATDSGLCSLDCCSEG